MSSCGSWTNLRRQIAGNWKGVKLKVFGKSILIQIRAEREEIFAPFLAAQPMAWRQANLAGFSGRCAKFTL
jgi:hypothetical protein